MQHSTLPALLGYDGSLLADLKQDEQRQIERVAEAWLLSSLLLACPVGYAAWLIEHSLLLACVLAAGALFVVLNMLRLSIAGGGVSAGARHKEVTEYRPALGATLVIGMLALLFAQPAQLPLWRTELDDVIKQHRQALITQHDRSLGVLGQSADSVSPARGSARLDRYRTELANCDFLVLRLTTLWKTPTRALQLTAFFVLVVLSPTLWARFVALDALRAYALARWRRDRRLITRAYARSEAERSALLAHFPSYEQRTSAFADPPFETRIESALLAPPLLQTKQKQKRWFQRGKRARKAGSKT